MVYAGKDAGTKIAVLEHLICQHTQKCIAQSIVVIFKQILSKKQEKSLLHVSQQIKSHSRAVKSKQLHCKWEILV